MANPNEIENQGQVTPENKDALQEEREKAEKKRLKERDEDMKSRAEKGEIVLKNSFVENFIRALGSIKDFFGNLFNPDGKPDATVNQGSGHYTHDSVDGEIKMKMQEGLVKDTFKRQKIYGKDVVQTTLTEENLDRMVTEATEEMAKRGMENNFDQIIHADPPVLGMDIIAKNSFHDQRAWARLLQLFKGNQAEAEKYREQFKDKDTNEPQKNIENDQVK